MTEVLDAREQQDVQPLTDTPDADGRRRRRRWGKGGSLVVDLHNVMGLFAAIAIIVVSGFRPQVCVRQR